MSEESQSPPWNKKLQEEAVSTVFQLITKWLESSVRWAKDAITWKQAAENYVFRWIDRWGQIQLLGADYAIPLHEIYVNLHAVPRSFVSRFASQQELETAATSRDRRLSSFSLTEEERLLPDYKPQPGMQIANDHERVILLGAPGAGKSTFLRRLGLEALLPRASADADRWRYHRQYKYSLLPVLLELRNLRGKLCETPRDIVNLLAHEFTVTGFPDSIKLLLAALKQGALLVLLDGVDEIPSIQLEPSIRAIRDFINQYPRCRYVLSCRTAFYHDWFKGFHDFILADFDDEQIADFARKWFTRPDEISGKASSNFLKLLHSDEHRATRELAGSPLLLTFLCLVFRRAQQFPPNRAQLYQKALRIYLEEWNASKLVHNEPLYKELTPEMEVELLKDIAGPAFIAGTIFFTKMELTEAVSVFLKKELNAPKSLSPGEIIDAIAVQQGLFVERAHDVWTFSHLTIQEYLAAAWILEEGQANELIFAHADDDRWREIFLLMSGLTRADDILGIMMDAADAIAVSCPSLHRLLTTVNSMAYEALRCAGQQSDLHATGGTVTHAILRALTLGIIAPSCSLLVHSIARANGLSLDEDKVRDIRVEFHLDGEIALRRARFSLGIHLEPKEQSEMDKYLLINSLVCACKEAGLRVSAEAWRAICARWLIPS